MYAAGVAIGAAIAPEDAAIENISALDCGKNSRDCNCIRLMREGVAAHCAARRNHDLGVIELLKNFCEKAGRNLGCGRDFAQLNRFAEGLSCEDHQSLDCILAFSAQLHARLGVNG